MAENIAITWRRIPERYRLDGSRCATCKTNYFPGRKFCPTCRRKGKIEPCRFAGTGKVYSFSEIFSPPAGFELEAPYVLAIVELDEGPKLTAQIVNCTDADVKIGSAVEMIFRKIKEDGEEGPIHYGYKFRLSK